MRVSYVIVYVSDMSRSVSFYRDTMGIPMRFETPSWTEFATDGSTLALHASEAADSVRMNPRSLPPGHCRPGLSVADLDAFHQRMIDLNVPCIQPPTMTFGTRIAQYLDPDGLGISVSESRGDWA
jgi:lactoylglutathione lyase